MLSPGLTVLAATTARARPASSRRSVGRARAIVPGCGRRRARPRRRRQAIVRAEVSEGTREQLFEAEIRAAGRNRVLCNKQPIARTRDLHGLLRVTVFAPDDLALVKEGPSARRTYLDELLGMLATRYDAARTDFDRVLKQRNALLRGGVRDDEARARHSTCSTSNSCVAGAELVRGRLRLLERLAPAIDAAYRSLAHDAALCHRPLRLRVE